MHLGEGGHRDGLPLSPLLEPGKLISGIWTEAGGGLVVLL